MPESFFWFEAQTGLIRWGRRPEGNYYNYALARINLLVVRQAVDKAEVGAHGLEYSAKFLNWLAANDITNPGVIQ